MLLDEQGILALDILNAQSLGVCVLDADLRVRCWNDWMAEWSRVPANDLIGRDITSIFPDLLSGDFARAVKRVTAKSEVVTWDDSDPELVSEVDMALTGGGNGEPLLAISLSSLQASSENLCLVQFQTGGRGESGRRNPTEADPESRSASVISGTSAIIEDIDCGLILIDQDRFIVSANGIIESSLHYPEQLLVGKPLRLVFPEIEAISATGTASAVEAVTAEGDSVSMSVLMMPVADDNRAGPARTAIICLPSDAETESEALLRQGEVLRHIYQHTADGIVLVSRDGFVEQINPVARQLLGLSEAKDYKGYMDDFMVLVDGGGAAVPSPADEALNRGTFVESMDDVFVKVPGREPEAVSISAMPLRNQLNRVDGAVIVFRAISEARRVSNRLTWQSSHDALTQLPNRRYLEAELIRAIDDVHVHSNVRHTLFYIDIYNFSVINDTCGHNAGDELLRQFARLLEKQFGANDVVARIGNDEFAVLLRGRPVEEARAVAEELIDAARSFSFPWEERRLKIGLSVGAKVIDSDVASEIDVLVAAGASCAAAKESGRNRVNFHYRAKEIALRKSMGEWIPRISEALEENRFQIYCQPIVPVRPDDEESRHFEILVRMLDAQGQLVLPGKFIPPAEHYGLIEDIDKWVLNYVFDYQARRMREGLPLTKFAINLSGKSIGDETLSEHILSNFEATGLDPHLFQFEITETAAIRNFDRAMELIRTLKTAGCYFALDDFGSGLSSFGYLKELPVDYLKIDGSFIRNMESNDVDYSMVSTINHLGHIMGIETIAECVENKAQLAMLKKIGVDYVQGHLFSEPRPIDEFS